MTSTSRSRAYTPDGGRDIDQRPCPEVEGVLLRRAGDLNPGELARVTGGQVKLARLLKKADPKVGQRAGDQVPRPGQGGRRNDEGLPGPSSAR